MILGALSRGTVYGSRGYGCSGLSRIAVTALGNPLQELKPQPVHSGGQGEARSPSVGSQIIECQTI